MAGAFISASIVILAGGGKGAAVAAFFSVTGCFLLPINGSRTDIRFAGAVRASVIYMTVDFSDNVGQIHNAALNITAALAFTRQAANTSLAICAAASLTFSSVSVIANATPSVCNVAVLSCLKSELISSFLRDGSMMDIYMWRLNNWLLLLNRCGLGHVRLTDYDPSFPTHNASLWYLL